MSVRVEQQDQGSTPPRAFAAIKTPLPQPAPERPAGAEPIAQPKEIVVARPYERPTAYLEDLSLSNTEQINALRAQVAWIAQWLRAHPAS